MAILTVEDRDLQERQAIALERIADALDEIRSEASQTRTVLQSLSFEAKSIAKNLP